LVEPIFTRFWQAVMTVGMVIAGIFGVVALAAINLLSATLSNFAELAKPVIDQVTVMVKLLGDQFSSTVALIQQLVAGDWAGAWETAKQMVARWFLYMNSTLNNILQFTSEIFKTIYNTVVNTLRDLGVDVDAKLKTIQGYWTTAWNIMTGLVDGLKSTLTTLADSTLERVKSALTSFKDFFSGFSLPNPFAGLMGSADSLLSKIQAVIDKLSKLSGMGGAGSSSVVDPSFNAEGMPSGNDGRSLFGGSKGMPASSSSLQPVTVNIGPVNIYNEMDMLTFEQRLLQAIRRRG
jgi:phage-related protein